MKNSGSYVLSCQYLCIIFANTFNDPSFAHNLYASGLIQFLPGALLLDILVMAAMISLIKGSSSSAVLVRSWGNSLSMVGSKADNLMRLKTLCLKW